MREITLSTTEGGELSLRICSTTLREGRGDEG